MKYLKDKISKRVIYSLLEFNSLVLSYQFKVNYLTNSTRHIMINIKVLVFSFLIISLTSLSGCYANKAGNYISEKSKAGWSATKSFFGADK